MAQPANIDGDIVQLGPDEIPLWSHQHAALSTRKSLSTEAHRTHARISKLYRFSLLPVAALYFWLSKDNFSSNDIIFYAFIGAAFVLGETAARYIKWRPVFGPNQIETYSNAVLTDQRMILYNHDADPPIVIQNTDITSAALDYEYGGLVLKVFRRSSSDPAILVGTGQFKDALAIMNQRLSIK